MTQVLNLEEHELDSLAGFLGHDLRIHREYYRLPDHAVQLAKVTRVLMAVDRGVSQFAGKRLKDIHLQDIEKMELKGKHFSTLVEPGSETMSVSWLVSWFS